MTQLTQHFSREELACKHCGQMHIPLASIERLQALRDKVGHVLRVTSGYRCPEHNNVVSSTGRKGPHTKAAFDIAIYGEDAYRLVRAAIDVGFTGIGVKQTGPVEQRFIHVDDLVGDADIVRPYIWSY